MSKAPRAGKFITLEGGDGAGKSTQIDRLSKTLNDRGIETLITREPGGTPEAEKIRALLVQRDGGDWDPVSEVLLLFAARREHVEKKIKPALAKGIWVLSDRFADSTLAFQGYGHGLDKILIREFYRLSIGDFKPDLTLILDLPVKKGLARSGSKLQSRDDFNSGTAEDRFERMGVEFHQRLRNGFLAIAKDEPDRCAVINALPDAKTVAQDIITVVDERLGVTA